MTVSAENNSDLRILLLDGVSEVLDTLQKKLEAKKWPHVFTYRIHHCEATATASIDRCCREIAGLIETHRINVIVSNHDIYNDGADGQAALKFEIKHFLSEANIFNSAEISPDVLDGFKKIIIHTYNPEISWDGIREMEGQVNQALQKDVAFFIELSSSFVKFDFEQNRRLDNPNTLPLQAPLRLAYEGNFAQILLKVLEEVANPKGDLHVFSEQFDALEKIKDLNTSNYELIRKLRADNKTDTLELLGNYSTELKNTIALADFTIGHVTFISNIKNKAESHLLDVPYKDYYERVNKKLEDEKTWTNIYKDKKGEFLEDQFVFFDYLIKGNQFEVYQLGFSKELQQLGRADAFMNFLPFLHASIFYDEDTWEGFKITSQSKPADAPCTIKLFFQFSRINNRSFTSVDELHSHLNYSLWTCNTANYDQGYVKGLEKKIRQSYFLDIKDIVQSTVILSMMDHIRQIEEEGRTAENRNRLAHEQLRFIKAHKHTIRNFGYEQKLVNLKMALDLDKIDKARDILSEVEKLNRLRDITIDFIYLAGEPVQRLLLFRELQNRGFFYSEILKIIDEGEGVKRQTLFIALGVRGAAADQLKKDDLITVFNLLVNLYSNTQKHSGDDDNFEITMALEKDQLIISFKTMTYLSDVYYDFLLDHTDYNPSEGQGLNIIKECLQKLKYYINIDIQRTESQTIITLIIHNI